MAIKKVVFIAGLLLLSAGSALAGRPVEGSSSVPQFGAPPKDVVDRVRAEAAVDFQNELRRWLRDVMRVNVDTANTIKLYALEKLAERCLESAEEKPVARGRVWTLTLSVPEAAVREAVRAHNDNYDSHAALHFQAARDNDPVIALPGAIGALSAAMMKIEPQGIPRNTTVVNTEEIRANVQILFDKMQVKAVGTIVEGRPGALPEKYPAVAYSIDGKPLADFHVSAFVQNGRLLERMVTDSRGEISLKDRKIPFVHNGSMLTITPDASAYIKADRFIRFRDLGIRFARGQEATYIFKLPPLTYTLEYAASTQEKDMRIPRDFSADEHVRKHLKDFCGLTPAAGGRAADMNIKIGAVVTQRSYDDTEEDAIITTITAEFRGGGISKSGRREFEKRYQYGINIQFGEYFWEASRAIGELIAETLSKDF